MKIDTFAMVVPLRTPHPYLCQGDCRQPAVWRVRANVNSPSMDLCTACLDELQAQIMDTLRHVRNEA